MKKQDVFVRHKDEIVWNLVSIENDISKLSVVLQGQKLQKEEMISTLLEEIETLAKDCRKRLVSLEFHAYQKHSTDEKSLVTQKEVRELLEAFA